MAVTVPTGYFEDLARRSFSPGWDKPTPSLWPSPRLDFVVQRWRYEEARAALHAAGSFVSTEEAERRNLICVNAVTGNTYATTRTLVAAYQMVRPGETARSHRHTPNALRLALDVPEGAYTVIDGVRVDMAPGDVVLTPSWSFHGHGNDGDTEAYWIDFLDVPLVHHLGAMFLEAHPSGIEPIISVDASSPWRAAAPGDEQGAATGGQVHRRVVAPGGLASIALEHLVFTPGAATSPARTTADRVFAVVEGEVVITVDDVEPLVARRGDVVAVPCWRRHALAASGPAVVLQVSDEPVVAALGFARAE